MSISVIANGFLSLDSAGGGNDSSLERLQTAFLYFSQDYSYNRQRKKSRGFCFDILTDGSDSCAVHVKPN